MKKIISILLTASMLAGSAATPFTAIAAETATTASQASEAEKSTMTTDINSTIKDLGVFEEGEKMTIDDVIELSKKGNSLTLNDFSKFKGVIAGSGIFILEYDLGKGYTLMVGSVALDKIDYARLRYSDSENYVDIRTDDVETFLKETSGDTNGNTNKVKATVLDINGKSLLLQSVSNCSERYLLSIEQIKGDITPTVGMSLEITYDGGMFNLVPILLIGNVKKVSVISEKTECLKGDANCDGGVDMADAVLIMQALANPNKYGEFSTEYNYLTALGRLNGDMNGDGLTVNDALAIQKKLLGLDEAETELDITRKKISDFVDENKINCMVIPKDRIPENYADKYIFINNNYSTSDEKEALNKFILQNDIDRSLLKYIPYDLDDDHEVNKIVEKLYWYILDNDIKASVSRFAGSNDPKFEDKVVISYRWQDEGVEEKINAFLEENNVDPELVIGPVLE